MKMWMNLFPTLERQSVCVCLCVYVCLPTKNKLRLNLLKYSHLKTQDICLHRLE